MSHLRIPLTSRRLLAALLVTLVPLASCASSPMFKMAEREAAAENWDAAVAYYQTAHDEHPDRVEYEIKLARAKVNAARMHRTMARRLQLGGDPQQAALEYQLAMRLDPGDQVAEAELRAVLEDLAVTAAAPRQPTRLEAVMQESTLTTFQAPRLEPQVNEISLRFDNAPIKSIYQSIARSAGLNVVFDPEIQDARVTVQLDQPLPFSEALTLVSRTNGHVVKAISSATFIVIPEAKRELYEDRLMRTFFLSNAQSAEVATLLRSVIQAYAIAENPIANSITLHAPPDVLDVAARLIATADKSLGEVLLEIEVLEVDRRILREYGISLSNYDITQSLNQPNGSIALDELRNLDATNWFFTIPSVRYRLFKETGDFKLVADPQLRVSEGAPASLLIGQRVPIVVTQFSPSQFVGGQIVPIRTTDYRDVGITLNVATQVHHNDEVSLDMQIEISSISGQIGVEDLPIFITREVKSTTRLRDGETTILAGLLRDDERTGVVGIPGLSDLPLIGKLFSSTRVEIEQVDVILTMTPHILRRREFDTADVDLMYLGRDSGLGEGRLVTVAAAAGGDAAAAVAGEEPVRDDLPPALALAAPAEIAPGEEFEVEVTAEGMRDLASIGLRLSFDTSVVQFVRAEEGDFLGAGGVQTAFETRQGAPGQAVIAVTRFGNASGSSGSGSVARLLFRAVQPGETAIEFDAVALRTTDGTSIAGDFRPVRVTVREPAP